MNAIHTSELNPLKETIKLYAKQLKIPAFAGYEKIVRQLSPGDGYDKFLCEIMKLEVMRLSRLTSGLTAPQQHQGFVGTSLHYTQINPAISRG